MNRTEGAAGNPLSHERMHTLIKFYTFTSADAQHGLYTGKTKYDYMRGRIKPDAILVFSSGTEVPLFSGLTVADYKLTLDAKAAE